MKKKDLSHEPLFHVSFFAPASVLGHVLAALDNRVEPGVKLVKELPPGKNTPREKKTTPKFVKVAQNVKKARKLKKLKKGKRYKLPRGTFRNDVTDIITGAGDKINFHQLKDALRAKGYNDTRVHAGVSDHLRFGNIKRTGDYVTLAKWSA